LLKSSSCLRADRAGKTFKPGAYSPLEVRFNIDVRLGVSKLNLNYFSTKRNTYPH